MNDNVNNWSVERAERHYNYTFASPKSTRQELDQAARRLRSAEGRQRERQLGWFAAAASICGIIGILAIIL